MKTGGRFGRKERVKKVELRKKASRAVKKRKKSYDKWEGKKLR